MTGPRFKGDESLLSEKFSYPKSDQKRTNCWWGKGKNLWKSSLLDTEDRKVLWSWFDLFVLLGEKYLKTYGYVKGWEPDNKNLEEKKNT